MDRHYPCIRIESIKILSKAIIIKATSIQNKGERSFIYKASGRKNFPHTKHLIATHKLKERNGIFINFREDYYN